VTGAESKAVAGGAGIWLATEVPYRWLPLTEADTPEWSELVTAIAEHDSTDELYSAADLAEELALPTVDPARDTLAARDVDTGALIAFGQLFFRDALIDGQVAAHTCGGVHPNHRGRGVGTELMRRLEGRAATGGAERHPRIATCLRADVGVQVADARQLMADRGFVETRYFHVMTHDFTALGDSNAASSPGLRHYDADTDADAVRAAHNGAFATHWRSAPWSAAEWTSRVGGSRTFRPALSFVQPGGDGSLDGYVLSFEYVPRELYIGMLGVRTHGRGRGTGAALLRVALAAGLAAGFERADLDVDSANSTGAGRLYESVGFRPVRATVAALKSLPVS
jgi:mycothiol synthase